MVTDPKSRRDRYDNSRNPEAEYVDVAQTVLVNKRGIADLATLLTVEEAALAHGEDDQEESKGVRLWGLTI
jgi:hypothetical protein